MITTDYHIVQTGDDLQLENGVAYHLRCEVDLEQHIILVGVFLDEGPMSVTITGVTPFIGHPKGPGCCDSDRHTKDLEEMLRRIVEAYDGWYGGEDHELITEAKALLERAGYTNDF